MYVISIEDRGDERNFLATNLSFVGHLLQATINGTPRQFDLAQLLDIMAVDDSLGPALTQRAMPQTRLS
jgi:hypothetical protein